MEMLNVRCTVDEYMKLLLNKMAGANGPLPSYMAIAIAIDTRVNGLVRSLLSRSTNHSYIPRHHVAH